MPNPQPMPKEKLTRDSELLQGSLSSSTTMASNTGQRALETVFSSPESTSSIVDYELPRELVVGSEKAWDDSTGWAVWKVSKVRGIFRLDRCRENKISNIRLLCNRRVMSNHVRSLSLRTAGNSWSLPNG